MPGGDGTGPAGLGPMTGRAVGFCTGYGAPGYVSPMSGRGFWGRGGGRGRRNWFYATGLTGWQRAAYGYAAPFGATPNMPTIAQGQEVELLRDQAKYLKNTLDSINKRIVDLESTLPDA